MAQNNNGGPAFPLPLLAGESYTGPGSWMGMSVRDYFAAQIAAGDAASSEWNTKVLQDGIEERAELYYRIADAMLKARSK